MTDVYLEVNNVYLGRGSVLRTKKEVGGMDHVLEQKNKNKIFSKRNFPDELFFSDFKKIDLFTNLCTWRYTPLS